MNTERPNPIIQIYRLTNSWNPFVYRGELGPCLVVASKWSGASFDVIEERLLGDGTPLLLTSGIELTLSPVAGRLFAISIDGRDDGKPIEAISLREAMMIAADRIDLSEDFRKRRSTKIELTEREVSFHSGGRLTQWRRPVQSDAKEIGRAKQDTDDD